jgi:hypothetical protein
MGLTTPVLTVRPKPALAAEGGRFVSLRFGRRLQPGARHARCAGWACVPIVRSYFEIDGTLGPAPVIFGEEGDEPLLGATTLESLGLVLDPFERRLIPMRMVLA